jgi:hypothetical protein
MACALASVWGAVSLAAALALPATFPERNLILLVTFGVIPTEPATDYGYLKPGQPLPDGTVRIPRAGSRHEQHRRQHDREDERSEVLIGIHGKIVAGIMGTVNFSRAFS